MPRPSTDAGRAARRKWYAANRERQLPQSRANKVRYVERNVEYVLAIKRTAVCADCDLSYPAPVMEFDHREDEDKDADISKMARWPVSLARLVAEIAKCDLVCANCHRLRSARRAGWAME